MQFSQYCAGFVFRNSAICFRNNVEVSCQNQRGLKGNILKFSVSEEFTKKKCGIVDSLLCVLAELLCLRSPAHKRVRLPT